MQATAKAPALLPPPPPQRRRHRRHRSLGPPLSSLVDTSVMTDDSHHHHHKPQAFQQPLSRRQAAANSSAGVLVWSGNLVPRRLRRGRQQQQPQQPQPPQPQPLDVGVVTPPSRRPVVPVESTTHDDTNHELDGDSLRIPPPVPHPNDDKEDDDVMRSATKKTCNRRLFPDMEQDDEISIVLLERRRSLGEPAANAAAPPPLSTSCLPTCGNNNDNNNNNPSYYLYRFSNLVADRRDNNNNNNKDAAPPVGRRWMRRVPTCTTADPTTTTQKRAQFIFSAADLFCATVCSDHHQQAALQDAVLGDNVVVTLDPSEDVSDLTGRLFDDPSVTTMSFVASASLLDKDDDDDDNIIVADTSFMAQLVDPASRRTMESPVDDHLNTAVVMNPQDLESTHAYSGTWCGALLGTGKKNQANSTNLLLCGALTSPCHVDARTTTTTTPPPSDRTAVSTITRDDPVSDTRTPSGGWGALLGTYLESLDRAMGIHAKPSPEPDVLNGVPLLTRSVSSSSSSEGSFRRCREDPPPLKLQPLGLTPRTPSTSWWNAGL